VNPDVAAWLASPEGERWSRARHDRAPEGNLLTAPWWRARGPLPIADDPSGPGPIENATTKERAA